MRNENTTMKFVFFNYFGKQKTNNQIVQRNSDTEFYTIFVEYCKTGGSLTQKLRGHFLPSRRATC